MQKIGNFFICLTFLLISAVVACWLSNIGFSIFSSYYQYHECLEKHALQDGLCRFRFIGLSFGLFAFWGIIAASPSLFLIYFPLSLWFWKNQAPISEFVIAGTLSAGFNGLVLFCLANSEGWQTLVIFPATGFVTALLHSLMLKAHPHLPEPARQGRQKIRRVFHGAWLWLQPAIRRRAFRLRCVQRYDFRHADHP